MNNVQKMYIINMPDGSRWALAVAYIALDQAVYFAASDSADDFQAALNQTCEIFSDPKEIADWAQNNMDWDEVKDVAYQTHPPNAPDYDEGWINGKWELS